MRGDGSPLGWCPMLRRVLSLTIASSVALAACREPAIAPVAQSFASDGGASCVRAEPIDAGAYAWDAGGPFTYDGLCESVGTCHRGPPGAGRPVWAQYLYADYISWQLVAADPCQASLVYAASFRAPAVFEGVDLPNLSGTQGASIMLARLDEQTGQALWARFFGGPEAHLDVQALVVRPDGKIVLAFAYVGRGDVGQGLTLPPVPSGEPLPLLVLLDSNGTVEKSLVMTGHAYGWLRPAAVDGNHVIIGGPFGGDWYDFSGDHVDLTYPDGGRHFDHVIYDVDEALTPRRIRTFELPPSHEDDEFSLMSVAVDRTGGIYVAQHYEPQQLTKLDGDGGDLWSISFDETDPSWWQATASPMGELVVTRHGQATFIVDQVFPDGGLGWRQFVPGQQRPVPVSTAVSPGGDISVFVRSTVAPAVDFGLGPISSFIGDAGYLVDGSDFLVSYDGAGLPRWTEAFPERAFENLGRGALELGSLTFSPRGGLYGAGAVGREVDPGFGWIDGPTGAYPFLGTGVVEKFDP